jgi:hypothetical protein
MDGGGRNNDVDVDMFILCTLAAETNGLKEQCESEDVYGLKKMYILLLPLCLFIA